MKRIIVASAFGLYLGFFAVGCGGGEGEGDSVRKETPTEKIPAPGASLGGPDVTNEGTPPDGE